MCVCVAIWNKEQEQKYLLPLDSLSSWYDMGVKISDH